MKSHRRVTKLLPVLVLLLSGILITAVVNPQQANNGSRGQSSGPLVPDIPPAWTIQTVDQVGDYGRPTFLVLDAYGYAHISYIDQTNSNLKYARWTGFDWEIQTVDNDADGGGSLVLDTAGNPHLVYTAWEGDYNNLIYAYWTGDAWEYEILDNGGAIGGPFSPSLALDNSANPHIAYIYDNSFIFPLNHVHWTGSEWSYEIVADRAESTSIALDSAGAPRISYTGGWDTIELRYARWAGNGWDNQYVDSIESVSGPSLELDAIGDPHISYYSGWSEGDLKYASWTGETWITQTVDSEGDVGSSNSLALDTNGNPHISYYDYTNGDLKYASWNGEVWDIQVVDSTGDVGSFTSLDLEAIGDPHISYYDATNGDLKYASLERVTLKFYLPAMIKP